MAGRTNSWSAFLGICTALPLFCFTAHAATVEEAGGSDFVAIGVDPSKLHDSESWKRNGVFRTPACQYDEHRAEADQQLRTMRASGQKKIGIILWFMHLDTKEDCTGFVLNSAGGHLTEKVLNNLHHLLETSTSLGFDEVQVRFAPLGQNRPSNWQGWDNTTYAENWSLISSTISAIAQWQGPRVIYDLSSELGGLHAPGCTECEPYVRRLWPDYLKRFSSHDSYGFSIAIAPGRVRQLLTDLQSAGGLPSELGIDTYHPAQPGIRVAAEEMRSMGVDLPVLIQETAYDDVEMYDAIVNQARTYHIKIRAIMQWPVLRGAGTHITESTTPAYIYNPTD